MSKSATTLIKWYNSHLSYSKMSIDNVKDAVLDLGKWLKNQKYKGIDVEISNKPKKMSSVYGFSLMGWINLYRLFNSKEYLKEAEHCLEMVLSLQTNEGGWLFPYAFRKNAPNFPYSCENLMTIRSLFQYYEQIEPKKAILESIDRALYFLIEYIGYREGVFWYSPSDKIRVPNISSMAANIFSKAYLTFNDINYLRKAEIFSDYCVHNQTYDGAFPYFEGGDMVYIPYHALETWELYEANEILKNDKIENSIKIAMNYLTKSLKERHYSSTNENKKYSFLLFKTPLWSARAYLLTNDYEEAFKHFNNALFLFNVPDRTYYFYLIRKLNLGKFNIYHPLLNSVYMRYNASCFEIGSALLGKCAELGDLKC